MSKYQKPIVVLILMMVFSVWFLRNTKRDFPLIFQKDLLAHDESSNSVVAANLTRKFFPPMVRVNPLITTQGNWMEGPYWQHIPPLFAYVPYIFFKLDGQVTIEVKRLSYAFVTLLTGLLFIFAVYKFRKSLLAASAATLAALLWLNTPFTHELITGYSFGVSDIVLAFTVVGGFGAILWYMRKQREERTEYKIWQLAILGLVVAIPIMAKNVLGAIPAATLFILLFTDFFSPPPSLPHKGGGTERIGSYSLPLVGRAREGGDPGYKNILVSFGVFIAALLVYFLPLFFASPSTFKNEILLSFFHFKNLEGWARPWNWYVVNYLPQRYLGNWTIPFYAGLILGLIINFSPRFAGEAGKLKILNRLDRVLLVLSGGWFLWNLIIISLVTSKVPNFIYQTYLLSIFFIVYSLVIVLRDLITKPRLFSVFLHKWMPGLITIVLIISIIITGYEGISFVRQFKLQRAQAYTYSTEHEKFYQTAEELRSLGVNTNDLIIVRLDDSDCWFRYYPLFLTGTESKTLLEMNFGFDAGAIKQKYNQMYFVINKNDPTPDFADQRIELVNYSVARFDLTKRSTTQVQSAIQAFINYHQKDINQDILRIKKDKTSCQWLVPDPILNAP